MKYVRTHLANMETNIQKNGNNLWISQPKEILKKQSLKEGSRVVLTETKSGFSIDVVKKKEG